MIYYNKKAGDSLPCLSSCPSLGSNECAFADPCHGGDVRLFYVALDSAKECLERIENRVRRGGHDIPHDDVIRRFAGRWEAVSKVLPYCDEAEFYDNDNGFALVAEYRNGELRTVGKHQPQWLRELQEYLVK